MPSLSHSGHVKELAFSASMSGSLLHERKQHCSVTASLIIFFVSAHFSNSGTLSASIDSRSSSSLILTLPLLRIDFSKSSSLGLRASGTASALSSSGCACFCRYSFGIPTFPVRLTVRPWYSSGSLSQMRPNSKLGPVAGASIFFLVVAPDVAAFDPPPAPWVDIPAWYCVSVKYCAWDRDDVRVSNVWLPRLPTRNWVALFAIFLISSSSLSSSSSSSSSASFFASPFASSAFGADAASPLLGFSAPLSLSTRFRRESSPSFAFKFDVRLITTQVFLGTMNSSSSYTAFDCASMTTSSKSPPPIHALLVHNCPLEINQADVHAVESYRIKRLGAFKFKVHRTRHVNNQYRNKK